MFNELIVYMADVSEIPEPTWERLLHRKRLPHDKSPLSGLSNGKPALHTPDDRPRAKTPTQGDIDADSASNSDLSGSPLPILVVDALWPLRSHPSHFSLAQALKTILRMQPSVTYLLGSTHPTTHFMWEEICLSFRRLNGQRQHPDADVAKGLVKRVWQSVEIGKGLGQDVREKGMKVDQAWDGLVVEVGNGLGNEGWREVHGPGGSAGGWGV